MIQEYKKPIKRDLPDACPTTGQFAVVWEFNRRVWAGTFKWIGSNLHRYIPESDTYLIIPSGGRFPWMNSSNKAKFYTQSNN